MADLKNEDIQKQLDDAHKEFDEESSQVEDLFESETEKPQPKTQAVPAEPVAEQESLQVDIVALIHLIETLIDKVEDCQRRLAGLEGIPVLPVGETKSVELKTFEPDGYKMLRNSNAHRPRG